MPKKSALAFPYVFSEFLLLKSQKVVNCKNRRKDINQLRGFLPKVMLDSKLSWKRCPATTCKLFFSNVRSPSAKILKSCFALSQTTQKCLHLRIIVFQNDIMSFWNFVPVWHMKKVIIKQEVNIFQVKESIILLKSESKSLFILRLMVKDLRSPQVL